MPDQSSSHWSSFSQLIIIIKIVINGKYGIMDVEQCLAGSCFLAVTGYAWSTIKSHWSSKIQLIIIIKIVIHGKLGIMDVEQCLTDSALCLINRQVSFKFKFKFIQQVKEGNTACWPSINKSNIHLFKTPIKSQRWCYQHNTKAQSLWRAP